MQAKANQTSPTAVEILDEASALLARTTAMATSTGTTTSDGEDRALQAWADHLASTLVDYCAVDLRLGVDRVVRLATGYRDRTQQAAADELAARSPVVAPIIAGGRTIGALTLATARRATAAGASADVGASLAEELARRIALNVENARLRAELRHFLRSREEMLSIVSHDVRNPLGVVLTGSALLLRGSLPPDKGDRARRQVEAIQRAGYRINTLIRDLLDFSSIESGELALALRPHDVARLLSEALDILRPTAVTKSQELASEPPTETLSVSCDRDRIVQVFANVVGNSMKFGPAGGHIRVSAVADGPIVRFTVADDGPGMESEELANLFDRSWQAQRKNRDGVGLGLGIVRGIVEAHGGRVWAESILGEGTRVHFTLAAA